MNQMPVWFDRKFDFTFPVEQHPSLCARLRATPVQLEEIIRGAAREALTRKPDDSEKWSAQEHAGHLADLEPLWAARVDDYFNEVSQLTVADLTNRKTSDAQHNQRAIEDIVAEFRGARSQLLSKIANTAPTLFGRTSLHPRLKTPMRLVDHLYFVAEHDDHHLAYIRALINADARTTY